MKNLSNYLNVSLDYLFEFSNENRFKEYDIDNLKLRPFVLPTIYVLSILTLIISVYYTAKTLKTSEESYNTYVTEAILDNDIPVVTENGTYFCVQRSSGKIIPVVLSPDDERLAILTPFKTMEDAMKAKEVVQKYIDAMHE